MDTEHRVVVASNDEALIAVARDVLTEAEDYRLVICRNEKEAAKRLDEIDVHLLLCDAACLESETKNLMIAARLSHSNVARIVVSTADQAVRGAKIARASAAYLYLVKPVYADQMGLVVKRALELNELSRRHRLLSRELKISMDDDIFGADTENSVKGGFSQFERLVYVSPKMSELVAAARQAAATELPVLINGETGTGKELLARALHFNSPRVDSPMHVQNCGGMSDDTLHSELFGHVRGAFTGAIADRLGLFRAADGGTVFLDEISEISASFQVSLLRFLQEGEVKPLGSDKMCHANVRIIAASNRPLSELVEKGEFRRDLYYRLKGFELRIPALRERREDISTLSEFFIEKYSGVVGRRVIGVTREALAKLESYNYPGNVRELETEIRRMVALAEHGGYITDRQLSESFKMVQPKSEAVLAPEMEGVSLKEMVETMERRVVETTLQRHRWNQSRAAQELGLSRVGLSNKIKRYGLHDT